MCFVYAGMSVSTMPDTKGKLSTSGSSSEPQGYRSPYLDSSKSKSFHFSPNHTPRSQRFNTSSPASIKSRIRFSDNYQESSNVVVSPPKLPQTTEKNPPSILRKPRSISQSETGYSRSRSRSHENGSSKSEESNSRFPMSFHDKTSTVTNTDIMNDKGNNMQR